MTELDIDCLISKLKKFDAVRDTDTINQGEVDRIQPAYADEWPGQLNASVREAMVNAGIARPYQRASPGVSVDRYLRQSAGTR